jgi:hypothetical protein
MSFNNKGPKLQLHHPSVGIKNGNGKSQIHHPKTQEIRVRPEDCDPIFCVSCERDIFFPASWLKNLPALLSPSGKTTTIAVGAGWFCLHCGHRYIQNPDNPNEIIPIGPTVTEEGDESSDGRSE